MWVFEVKHRLGAKLSVQLKGNAEINRLQDGVCLFFRSEIARHLVRGQEPFCSGHGVAPTRFLEKLLAPHAPFRLPDVDFVDASHERVELALGVA